MTTRPDVDGLVPADLAFFRGLLDRDIPALEALLAEEFLIVDVATGSVHPRAAFLAAISDGMVSFQEIETFPDDGDAEGALTEVASRYTHVFQADDRDWRLLSAQGTPIVDESRP